MITTVVVEQRMKELQQELGKGRQRCNELQQELGIMQSTCFRIEGAIEVLNEQLQQLQKQDTVSTNGVELLKDEEMPARRKSHA